MQTNFGDIPGQYNLFLDYLYEFDNVKRFYKHDFRNKDEYLKIFKDLPKDVCRILYRPFGGSFVSLLFPPVKYRVKLPDKHNQYMVDSINLICEDVYNWL